PAGMAGDADVHPAGGGGAGTDRGGHPAGRPRDQRRAVRPGGRALHRGGAGGTTVDDQRHQRLEPPRSRRPGLATVVTAERLRALHRPGAPLMLPNVWDAASARAVRAAGFPAVATSSAALAEALGYADGEAAPVAEVLDAVARIAAAVPVPVTADLERGYGMAPAELVERLAATGAVGCNLEDSRPGTGALVEVGEQVDFIAGVREAARTAGVDLVINARIDTYLRGDSPPAGGAPAGGDRLAETV